MAYSTPLDLALACGAASTSGTSDSRYVQLFDWDNDRIVNDADVASVIRSADRQIDSYLVKVYQVPLVDPIPQEIVDCSARIAVALTRFRRGMLDAGTKEMYDADILWLKSIRDGECALSVAPQPTSTTMRVDSSTERPLSKDVSRKKLQGYS